MAQNKNPKKIGKNMLTIDGSNLVEDLGAVIAAEKEVVEINRKFRANMLRENERLRLKQQAARQSVVLAICAHVENSFKTAIKSPKVIELLAETSTGRWRPRHANDDMVGISSTLELTRGAFSKTLTVVLCIASTRKGKYRFAVFTQPSDRPDINDPWLREIETNELDQVPETLDDTLKAWANPNVLVRAIVRALYDYR